jgi:hypothetical protein
MEERRKLKRRHMMFYSRVFDRKTGKHLGYLGNLTPAGIMIISEEPLDLNRDIDLRIDLPEDIYKKPVLNFKGRSIWSQPDVDPRFSNTGFNLLEINPDDLDIIEQIVVDYGVRD